MPRTEMWWIDPEHAMYYPNMYLAEFVEMTAAWTVFFELKKYNCKRLEAKQSFQLKKKGKQRFKSVGEHINSGS